MSMSVIAEARTSLERVQSFDTNLLPQTEKLGADLSFQEAVAPANRLRNLFAQFPSQYLEELPDGQIMVMKNEADAFFNILSEIVGFDPKVSDAYPRRNGLVESLRNQYQGTFAAIHPLISYGASRLRDYSAMEREARAAMQAATDRAQAIAEELEERRNDARSILEEVRNTAAEQGVSQQAVYFRDESAAHDLEAAHWQRLTLYLAIGLGLFAALSVFVHKIPILVPQTTYDAVQLGISKFLVFAVIAYVLFLSAKNFLSHKHNAIVNRHRQNALLTFKALADAAGAEDKRDIVLTYAASCIFAPQETGYAKGSNQADLPTNIIQAIPKIASSGGS